MLLFKMAERDNMTIEKVTFDASIGKMFSGGSEWMKSFFEAPMNTYATLSRESLAIMARSIQTQADYFKKLSECQGPAEVLSCQSEFAQKGLSRCVQDGQHLLEIVRSSYVAPVTTK